MRTLEDEELKSIQGGTDISASFITAIVRGVNAFLDIGRSLGTVIRRLASGNVCSVE